MADKDAPWEARRETGRLAERMVANFSHCALQAFTPNPAALNTLSDGNGTEVEWVNGIEEQMRPVDIVIRFVQQRQLVTALCPSLKPCCTQTHLHRGLRCGSASRVASM